LTGDALRLAEGFIAVTPIGPVPIKGLKEPVEVYEVTGAGAASFSPARRRRAGPSPPALVAVTVVMRVRTPAERERRASSDWAPRPPPCCRQLLQLAGSCPLDA
jgi:hypothetical protein